MILIALVSSSVMLLGLTTRASEHASHLNLERILAVDAEEGVSSLAATDILLGYHSEEGWTAAIHLLTKHYGIEVEVCAPACRLVACSHLEGREACNRQDVQQLLDVKGIADRGFSS